MRPPWSGLTLAALVLAFFGTTTPARAQSEEATAPQPPPPASSEAPTASEPPAASWRFAVEPYLWLVGVDGTLKYDIPSGGGGGPDVGLTLEDLDFTFMISAEARKGKWSILTDLAYVDIATEHDDLESVRFPGSRDVIQVDVDPDSETGSTITAWEWTLAGGYTVARGSRASFDVLGGFRYLTLEAKSEWRLEGDVQGPGPGQSFDRHGDASKRVDLWDGIVGVRGEILLGRRWFVPYYADVGTGTSKLTWQVLTGIGYRMSWCDLRLAYRHLAYDMKDDDLLQETALSGAAVGARFRF